MADAVGAKADAVRKWKKFGRIPSDSWSAVINAVRAVNGAELTLDQLQSFNAPMRQRGRPPRTRKVRARRRMSAKDRSGQPTSNTV